MDLRKLKKLIDLVEESGISEIEVTEGEEKVRITRTVAAPAPAQTIYATAPMAAPVAPAPAPVAAAPVAAAAAPSAPAARDLSQAQKSPMVGTFYRAQAQAHLRLWKWAQRLKRATRCALLKP